MLLVHATLLVVAGRRSDLMGVSPPCRLSTTDWPSLAVEAAFDNWGLFGGEKPGPDTDFKQLRRPGSRGSGAFTPGGFRFEIGS
ncbi:unnamed protein product [Coregonus sp. 'balchen']|nr:unnamed protein product [Coregonus sp. 'balchen']